MILSKLLSSYSLHSSDLILLACNSCTVKHVLSSHSKNSKNWLSLNAGRERSGSVVECLTRERGAAGSSLTGVTALWSLSKTHLS